MFYLLLTRRELRGFERGLIGLGFEKKKGFGKGIVEENKKKRFERGLIKEEGKNR